MTMFWILAIVMLLVAVAILAPALLGKGRKTGLDREQQNISIAREKLAELKSNRDSGVMADEEYQQARTELEASLLNDVAGESQAKQASASLGKYALLAVLVLVPALSIPLYLDLGNPDAIDKAGQQQNVQANPHQQGQTMDMADAASRLAEKLAKDPGNGDGWYLLGQTYMALGRHAEASLAFARSYEILGDNPNLMLRYADALAMSNNGRISGKPFELIKKALKISPDNLTALWLAGMGYAEQGDFNNALQHWRKLEPMLEGDPQSLTEVRNLIAQAEKNLGMTPGQSATLKPQQAQSAKPAQVTVKVSLDKQFMQEVSQDDTVFVFARAVSGPPIPLAVTRTTVADLPIEIVLTDDMAMSPQMKLSDHREVNINARVSRSGQPIAQSGDLEGKTQRVQVSSSETVNILIQKRVP